MPEPDEFSENYEDSRPFESLDEEFQLNVQIIAECRGKGIDEAMDAIRLTRNLLCLDTLEDAVAFTFEVTNVMHKVRLIEEPPKES